MFTGIISDLGRVRSLEQRGDTHVVIETGYDTAGIAIGASIACSGACLTVEDRGPGWFSVAASAETMSKTTLGDWREGTAINLERALRAGDELGGHIVSGHVDGLTEIISREPEGESVRFRFGLPAWLKPFVAPKGSIAIDGISLTVNEVEPDAFGVNIIPHTQAVTSFGTAKIGDRVNVEIDMLARYVERLLSVRADGSED